MSDIILWERDICPLIYVRTYALYKVEGGVSDFDYVKGDQS